MTDDNNVRSVECSCSGGQSRPSRCVGDTYTDCKINGEGDSAEVCCGERQSWSRNEMHCILVGSHQDCPGGEKQ